MNHALTKSVDITFKRMQAVPTCSALCVSMNFAGDVLVNTQAMCIAKMIMEQFVVNDRLFLDFSMQFLV